MTALVQAPRLVAGRWAKAFALISRTGAMVTWGDPDCGGDCSAVRGLLRDVRDVKASGGAMAARRGDGKVAPRRS